MSTQQERIYDDTDNYEASEEWFINFEEELWEKSENDSELDLEEIKESHVIKYSAIPETLIKKEIPSFLPNAIFLIIKKYCQNIILICKNEDIIRKQIKLVRETNFYDYIYIKNMVITTKNTGILKLRVSKEIYLENSQINMNGKSKFKDYDDAKHKDAVFDGPDVYDEGYNDDDDEYSYYNGNIDGFDGGIIDIDCINLKMVKNSIICSDGQNPRNYGIPGAGGEIYISVQSKNWRQGSTPKYVTANPGQSCMTGQLGKEGTVMITKKKIN